MIASRSADISINPNEANLFRIRAGPLRRAPPPDFILIDCREHALVAARGPCRAVQPLAAAGNPNITDELLKGKEIGGRTYRNHLDGYNQLAAITGKGPSARHEIFYLGESTVGAVRIDDYKYRFIDQPAGWLGEKTKPDVPYITNLRLDPFERTGWPNNGTKEGGQQYFDWFKYQFWRFVFVQQLVAKELQTFIDYPPMQRGASFNLDAVKAEMGKRMEQAEAASKGSGQ